MPDYRIDPHLRHDFSKPPPQRRHPPWSSRPHPNPPPSPPPYHPPPFQTPRASTRGLLRYWWRQLRLWLLRREVRWGQWWVQRLPRSLQEEAVALRLLVLALTLVVLLQGVLLVLAAAQVDLTEALLLAYSAALGFALGLFQVWRDHRTAR